MTPMEDEMMGVAGREPILYAACVSPLQDAGLYAAACEAVSPERREAAERLQKEDAARLSLGGELLLRHGLREAGLDWLPERFAYGSEGKPRLCESKLWFNISHSGQWAICAIADCETGCDIEEIRPIDLKIARRFRPEEYDDILAQSTEQARLECFFRYWTLKESFMKALGLGFGLPLKAFQMVPGETVSVLHSVNDRSYSFQEFDEIPGYKCALCVEDERCNAQLQIVDLAALL